MPESPLLLDINGHRITGVQVQQAMRINILAGCLGILWFAMSVGMPLTMFMEAAGAGGAMIGVLTAVRQCVMSVQIPSAFLTEHLGSRRRFWAPATLIQRSLWFLIAGLALYSHPGGWWILVGIVSLVGLSDLVGNAGSAAWNSWMADLIPSKSAGQFWGRRQGIVTAVSLLGMALAGFLLDAFRVPGTARTSPFGFALVFGISAVLGVGDVLIHLLVKEPRPASVEFKAGILRRLVAPLRSHDFRQLTLAMGTWSFACSMLGPFSLIYLKRYFPITYTQVAVVTIAGSLGSATTSFIFGSLTDRLGPRVLCSILMILAPFTALPWFFVDTSFITFHLPWIGEWSVPQVEVLIAFSSFIGGGIFSGIGPCQLRLAAQLSNSTGRTMAMAVHWSLIGLIAALGSISGGWVMDFVNAHPPLCVFHNGTAFSFLHAIIIAFTLLVLGLAVPLMLSIRTAVDRVAFKVAVSRMMSTNPFNAVRNFYTLQVISTPDSTPKERAEAARSLGKHKSGMAVPELIAHLEDPVVDVQEEAIEALGTIATDESVDALLRKLDDPACDNVPQICRALRDCGDSRCVPALLRRLQSDEREVQGEAARTLGRIGDRSAIPHLLDLITHNHDSKVLAACSEALAALGELSAAFQIVPQMRAAANRTLKRTLAIAAGDLLGKRETFYQLLIADTETPGAGANEVVRDLTRVVKKKFPKATRQIETLEMLEAAYVEGNVARCAELLLHLGLHLVQFMHRLPITLDPNEAMNRLLACDRQSAIGVWYLKILNEPWGDGKRPDSRDSIDILLGLHIVLSFTEPSPE